MTLDASVTTGHALYCVHRFRDDVRHMVIFDRRNDQEHQRTRLFLTDAEYTDLLRSAESGEINIVLHCSVIEGHIVEDNRKTPKTPQRKKAKLKRRIRK